jgi:hypothetical protein
MKNAIRLPLLVTALITLASGLALSANGVGRRPASRFVRLGLHERVGVDEVTRRRTENGSALLQSC